MPRVTFDDALVEKVIDKLHESVALARDGLRGNQMSLIYEELRNEVPQAKEIVKNMKLRGLCHASGGRLQYNENQGSGWICLSPDSFQRVPAALAPEEKKEKKKGKKEGKTKEKKGKTKEKKKKDPPWTEDANIPESFVTAMVAWVQEPEVKEQIKVHLDQHAVVAVFDHWFGARQENMNSSYKKDFIREVQKGIAEVNKEKLYKGDDHKDRLQVMRDEICSPRGDSPPNDQLIIAGLKHKAIELNVTTTDLGRALAGSSYIKAAIDERNRNTSDVTHLPDTDDCDNRRLVAKATVSCCHKDYITGYTCKSRDTGHVVEAQKHDRRMYDQSRRGEKRLVEDLRNAGYPRNSYKTEKETKDREPEATPDVLFHDPQTIRGKQVKWIDVKSACVIPEVTPERVIAALRAQVEKYVRKFGPGAILWTKCGFCKDVLSGVKGVSHFRPNANSHGQPSRERQAGPSRSSVPDERDPVGRLGPRQAFAAPGSATAAEAHELIDRLGHEGVQEYGILNFTELQEDLAPFFTYVQQRERRGQTTGGTQVTSEEDMREHRLRVFDQ
jgi:hypothetical protein